MGYNRPESKLKVRIDDNIVIIITIIISLEALGGGAAAPRTPPVCSAFGLAFRGYTQGRFWAASRRPSMSISISIRISILFPKNPETKNDL